MLTLDSIGRPDKISTTSSHYTKATKITHLIASPKTDLIPNFPILCILHPCCKLCLLSTPSPSVEDCLTAGQINPTTPPSQQISIGAFLRLRLFASTSGFSERSLSYLLTPAPSFLFASNIKLSGGSTI